ncbi:MAG: poly-gamma-glutamate hydrolase family protein [Longimicrobiales bacterium]|nr:poly-gamma-glutamate hydrolase family protein [Longimicrobiales bacterium]
MADTYKSFQELKVQEREGEDWTREYISRGSRILVMALHGGWIEPFTSELARAVAGNDLSLYTFQGLKKRGNESLHLTSHRFDEPLGLGAASAAHWVLAIHGERSSDRHFVMVGGLWYSFRDRLVEALEEAGFPVESPREGLDGVNPTNICNRGRSGTGAQLEISGGLRRTLRKDPEEFRRFVALVRDTLFHAERNNDDRGVPCPLI